MISLAIFSADPAQRRCLEQLWGANTDVFVAGIVDDPAAMLGLLDGGAVGVVVADAPPREVLADWCARHERSRFVALSDESEPEECLALLQAGATAVLPRAAAPEAIMAAVKAAASGLAVLPRALLTPLLDGPLADTLPEREAVPLTPREIEVLAAMADGASNKAIARRLGISFHTAKFHVAAILAKLDADSRTEAVAKAAQRGLVML
jgi:DNA-binding NarL/FixJ family response regulator